MAVLCKDRRGEVYGRSREHPDAICVLVRWRRATWIIIPSKNVNHGHAFVMICIEQSSPKRFQSARPSCTTALGHVVDSAGEPVSTIWVGPRCCRNGCSLLSRMKAEARARLAMTSAETQSSSSSPRRRAELAPHRGEAGVVFLSHAVSRFHRRIR